MKASVLGLLVAAVAFGASTIYLSVQLAEERANADKLAEVTRGLNARIAELEKARAERRYAGGGVFEGGAFARGGVPVGPPHGAADMTELKVDSADAGPPAAVFQAPRGEAFKKMMRGQIRANNKQLYADVGAQLGLSKDDASKLIDLITDQQVNSFDRMRDAASEEDRRRLMDDAHREDEAAIANLIGADKADALAEYMKTIPARQELAMLSRQLEGSDASLNADQNKRMLAVLVEERQRVPMPKLSDSATQEEFAKSYSDWQTDYNERVESQARSILNTEQLQAYNDYQQWQKEMRTQMATMRPGRGPRGPGGGVVFSMAAPIGADVAVATTPTEKPRKGQ